MKNSIYQIRKASQNEEERVIEFIASDESVDSYGTVIRASAWNLERFNSNGIIGYQHDVYGHDFFKSPDPDNVIGKGEARVEDGKLIVRVTFEPEDLNPKADKIYRKILFGSLNGVSVGFMEKAGHMGDKTLGEDPDVYYYTDVELCEISVVNIPANANALKRSLEERADALLRQMVEACGLESVEEKLLAIRAEKVKLADPKPAPEDEAELKAKEDAARAALHETIRIAQQLF